MCPIDPSPHAGEVMHEPGKQFPAPSPDGLHERKPEGDVSVTGRPAIPAHSELMGVDVEDEDADPVVESGPGVDDATTTPTNKEST
ncbi:MAG: hypothetical protein H7332_06075 [Bdellovibrionales bacterium]|nr:hypothetical protein [Ramlibacter sp.]